MCVGVKESFSTMMNDKYNRKTHAAKKKKKNKTKNPIVKKNIHIFLVAGWMSLDIVVCLGGGAAVFNYGIHTNVYFGIGQRV